MRHGEYHCCIFVDDDTQTSAAIFHRYVGAAQAPHAVANAFINTCVHAQVPHGFASGDFVKHFITQNEMSQDI